MLVFLGVVASSCVWIRRRPIFQHATVNTNRKTSGVGGGCEGGASARPKVCLLKIQAKFWVISVKTFAKTLIIWAKMVPNVVWFEKKQRLTSAESHEILFLELIPKEGLLEKMFAQKWSKNFSGKCGEIRAKILRTPKNLPAPAPMRKTVAGWRPEHARLPVHASSRAATAFLEEESHRSASSCFQLLMYFGNLETGACSAQTFPSGATQHHLIQRNAWAWRLECCSVAPQ